MAVNKPTDDCERFPTLKDLNLLKDEMKIALSFIQLSIKVSKTTRNELS